MAGQPFLVVFRDKSQKLCFSKFIHSFQNGILVNGVVIWPKVNKVANFIRHPISDLYQRNSRTVPKFCIPTAPICIIRLTTFLWKFQCQFQNLMAGLRVNSQDLGQDFKITYGWNMICQTHIYDGPFPVNDFISWMSSGIDSIQVNQPK